MAAELVVVTGASTGIGSGFSTEHPCLLISRHLEAHPELEDQPVLYRQLDVGDADKLGAYQGRRKPMGPTGCLINNAGMIHIGDLEA